MNRLTTRQLVDRVIGLTPGVNIDYEGQMWTVVTVRVVLGGVRVSVFPRDLPEGHAGLGHSFDIPREDVDTPMWDTFN